jgi:hypothetical protein
LGRWMGMGGDDSVSARVFPPLIVAYSLCSPPGFRPPDTYTP